MAQHLSIPRIHEAVSEELEPHAEAFTGGRLLDIGPGQGELLDLLCTRYRLTGHACDYRSDLLAPGKYEFVDANLDSDPLPYADGTFDVVTCTEVIEHIENHRRFFREVRRVLKPGGLLVVSTPNILSLKSRLRFFGFGFWSLFGPLHVHESAMHATGGHINPVGYFHVVHSALDAELHSVSWRIDKVQRSALLPLIFFYPGIWLYARLAEAKERARYKTIDAHNAGIVAAMNSPRMLLGRTIVVTFRK